MADPAPAHLTVDAFLARTWPGETAHELIAGVPVAMNPPTRAHQILAINLAAALHRALAGRPDCVARAEAGIRVADDAWYQADLAVDCRAPEGSDPGAPAVLIEILSPTTEGHDRRRKLPDYRALPSVRHIVLVDSRAPYVEVWHRQPDDRWVVDQLRAEGHRLILDTPPLDLTLADLYDRVPLDPES